MSGDRWKAEVSAYRMSSEYRQPMALVYDPTPGGVKNEDGSTTFSMRFPALILTEWVSDRETIAAKLAVELNTFDPLLKAAKEVMAMLEEHGGSIVPHLLDTDMNAGQRLREAIAAAEAQP